MMIFKRSLVSALLLSLSAVVSAGGVISPVDFDGIRPLTGFEQIKFKTDDSGRANLPRTPPNLTRDHINRIARTMSGATGGQQAPRELTHRIANILARTDMTSSTPVTRQEWDARIAAFERDYKAMPPAANAEDLEKGIDKLIANLVKAPNDPHTQYFDRRQWQQLIEAQRNAGFVGIGAHVEVDPAGVKIARPIPQSPTATAVLTQGGRQVATGIKKGDIIVAIDRVPAAGMAIDEAVKRLRGVPGTTVQLRILRDGQQYDAAVTRAHVNSPNSFARLAAPGVGYVYFAGFRDNTDTEVFAHIDRLKSQGARKLVLDVRGNPGGSLKVVQSIASEFLRDNQQITTTRTQGIIIQNVTVDGDGRYKDMPVAVLIDSASASASEILAAVLQDHARGKVVGWQSYGKGTFQSVIPTEIPIEVGGIILGREQDGTGVKVTGGGWFSPRGTSIDGRHDATGRNIPGTGGVVPDIMVNVSAAEQEAVMEGITEQLYGSGSAAAYDPVLGAAVQQLSTVR